MITLIIGIIIIILSAIALYHVTLHIIKMWAGCSHQEAEQKVHNFLNGKTQYHLNEDNMLFDECFYNIRSVIGENRFNDLEQFSRSTQMVWTGIMSGIPYIAFTVTYNDENEKDRIENLIKNSFMKFQNIHQLSNITITTWKNNKILNLPTLFIGYAENSEQEMLIKKHILHQNRKLNEKYQPLKEETDDDIE